MKIFINRGWMASEISEGNFLLECFNNLSVLHFQIVIRRREKLKLNINK